VDKQFSHNFVFFLPDHLHKRRSFCFLVNEKGVVLGKCKAVLVLDDDLTFKFNFHRGDEERSRRQETLDVLNGIFDPVGKWPSLTRGTNEKTHSHVLPFTRFPETYEVEPLREEKPG